jgi:hypothetical protein
MKAVITTDSATYDAAVKRMDFAKSEAIARGKSIVELYGAIKDCRETLQAWPNHPNEGYYLDEMHICIAELRRRQK